MRAYRYHQIDPTEGYWESEDFTPADRHDIVRGVTAGYLSGHPRWATYLDGTFVYGLDAKGRAMNQDQAKLLRWKARYGDKAPSHATKKKSPAQLQREIDEALSKSARSSPIVPNYQETWWEKAESARWDKKSKGPTHATKKTGPTHATKKTKGSITRASTSTAAYLRRELSRELLARGDEPSAQYAEGLDDAEVTELARGRGKLSGGRMSYSRRDLTEMADAIEAV